MTSGIEPNPSADSEDGLRSQIQSSLERSRHQRNKLKRVDRRFSIGSLVLSAIATFIAGESAIAGEPIVGNWRFTATLASACTLGATIATGIHRQVVPTDLLIETSECTAQLKVLVIETAADVYDVETVRDTYQQLIAEFSNLDF